jgi:tellurite resistance protein TerC
MSKQLFPWFAFNIFVLVMLFLDLAVFHRKSRVITIKESLVLSAIWTILALLFNLGIYFWQSPEKALEFLTGYVIERSLSVDNLFIFLLVFAYFGVPSLYQHKVLFWGILGALIMRVIFITAGVTLIERFHWIMYIFGAFLILTGIRMTLQKDKKIRPERNPAIRIFRRFMPVTDHYAGGSFFVKESGRYLATPLFLVLLVVETTDIVFAVDSIPAIFAITLDPFIVYTSNVFAMLGLRALYFALAGAMGLCSSFHYGFSAILVFLGGKMLLAPIFKIPVGIALGVVGSILMISAIACIFRRRKAEIIPADSLGEDRKVGTTDQRQGEP